MTFTIAYSMLARAEEKVEKFEKKFRKFGGTDFVFTVSSPYYKEVEVDSKKETIKVVDINVSGSYKVGDYEFVASLEFVPAVGKNIVRKVSGTEDIPEMYLTRNECDHCMSNRARKYTVLLRSKTDGSYIQVGKQCVKDFVGCDINSYIGYLSSFTGLEEDLNTISEMRNYYDTSFKLDEVLGQAVAEIKANGYVSNAVINKWFEKNCFEYDTYYDCPLKTTASVVYNLMTKKTSEKYDVTDEIMKEVEDVKDFIKNTEDGGDYINNLKIILELGYVERRNVGLAVSMVGYYIRSLEKKKEQEKVSTSSFIGNVGDKITFTSTPECVCSFETEYGYMRIYKFNVDGNEVVWKTSKFLEEQTITLRGTIKAHKVYNGVNQTEITRARVA